MAAVRMGRIDGNLVVNPLRSDMDRTDISMVVAAKPDSIVMLEGGANIVEEEAVLEALFKAHEELQAIFEIQRELRRMAGKPKRDFKRKELDRAMVEAMRRAHRESLEVALSTPGKKERSAALYELEDRVVAEMSERYPGAEHDLRAAYEHLLRERVRRVIVDDDRRIDDRRSTDIRPLSATVQVLPRTHGSALFTPRRDPGIGHSHAGHLVGRAEDRRAARRALQKIHAPL